ncbi:MAG: cation-translocating P-type ATPase [Firmicutes bacterium]|nr:cation-translocating P-type ATPase [Bacillota bacterium]
MYRWYQMPADEVISHFGASRSGLTEAQVKSAVDKWGMNNLAEGKKASILQVFLRQFKDLLVLILIAAAGISIFTGNIESTIVILVVIVLNAVLGTMQHIKAEKSLESLKAMSAPSAKVIRNGEKAVIASKEIVPGDILMLEAGDLVAADGRIIENYSLQVNESSLTGESLGADKQEEAIGGEAALADRKNMVYSGSLVTYGRAVVLVTETGMNTEIGRIAAMMNETEEKRTPLQQSLDRFSSRLAIIVTAISAVVFFLALYRQMPILEALMFAVALAVAAIPEALGSIVTIVQAVGTQKMAAENAIVKDLRAVESLGCVSVICSDKTGTLTQNKMTVVDIYADGMVMKPEELAQCFIRAAEAEPELKDAGFKRKSESINITENWNRQKDKTAKEGDKAISLHNISDRTKPAEVEKNPTKATGFQKIGRLLLYDAVLANDSVFIDGVGVGDPTEYALLTMTQKIGVDYEAIRDHFVRLAEIPFDSERKMMSAEYMIENVKTVLVKGAVDVMLDRTINILTADGVKSISEADRNRILEKNNEFSQQGLRVLAFAYKEPEQNEILSEETETNFTFLGLISMIDPPRAESEEAVADAVRAGIRPIMITGDHKVTATAIAEEIGIFRKGDKAIIGTELDGLSDEEFSEEIEKISVYARVSPENKIRIVDMWQKKGKIVSMTGDGVNDAPALKKADIGVAMGVTGTDVSKDAASMILADDNFATIIKAVANGRNVYKNIKNAIFFLLSGNTAGIIAVLYTSIMALPVPFKPVHLLFINLLTDSLPALAIGMEPPEKNLLDQKPRDPKQGILTGEFFIKIIIQGGLIGAATIAAFYAGLEVNEAVANTMAFGTLALARLFHGMNCRSDYSILKIGFRRNWYSLAALGLGCILLILVLYVPFLHSLFALAPLTTHQVWQIVWLALAPTVIIQVVKIIGDMKNSKSV